MKKLFQFWPFLCLIGLGVTPLGAQTPILMTAGYRTPTPMVVAPGQVVNLYVSGTPTVLPATTPTIQATTVPLPATLGGFSVTMRQGTSSYAVPLFSVEQVANCTDADTATPQCTTTILTVQIPAEIGPVMALWDMSSQPPSDLSVDDNGTISAHFSVVPLVDNIHVLTTCDLQNQGQYSVIPSPCPAIVTHADGTMVSQLSPALGGETVVIYAYGLGLTVPVVESGNATPAVLSPVLEAPNFGTQFDFRQNAGPAIPSWTVGMVNGVKVANRAPAPPFAGLTPGQVGLYQINVTIPNPVPPVQPCPVLADCLGSFVGCFVQSNLTIDISGVSSFDGAAICVQPPL
jgi:uncharacterized protein (TIGR03437 family)